MSVRARWLNVVVAGMLAIIGCTPDQDNLVAPKGGQERVEIVRRLVGDCTNPSLRAGPQSGRGSLSTTLWPEIYEPAYTCGETIGILPGANFPTMDGSIGAAVSEWNTALSGLSGVPVFSTDSQPVSWHVVFNPSLPTGDYEAYTYCGATASGNVINVIYNDGGGINCAPLYLTGIVTWAELPTLLAHEMAHVHGMFHFPGSEIVDGCATVVHPGQPFGHVCAQMIDLIGSAYGMTAYNPAGFQHYFGGIVMRGEDATPSLGDTVRVWADTMIALDGSGSNPGTGTYGLSGVLSSFDWDVTGPGTIVDSSNGLWRDVRIDGYGVISVTADIDNAGPDWRVDTDYPAVQGSYPMIVAPPAPDTLYTDSVGSSSTRVKWTPISGTSTVVEYKTAAAGSWSSGGTRGSGIDTLTLTSLSSSTYYSVRIWAVAGGVPGDTLQKNSLFQTGSSGNTLPPPSNINVTGVGYTEATIGYTAGTTGVVTWIQINDGNGWVNAIGSSVAFYQTSVYVPGLVVNTTYDVRAWHARPLTGESSDTVTVNDAFTTPYAPIVTAFNYTDCELYLDGIKEYATFYGTWTVDGDTSGWDWQITAYNGAYTAVFASGSSGTSSAIYDAMQHGWPAGIAIAVGYVKSGEPDGPVTGLDANPLDVNQCVPASPRHVASASPLLANPFAKLTQAALRH